MTAGNVNLASEVTGTLPVASGGTGAATLTANNVLLGNGASAVQTVAPSTSGNVLTSNGTTWTSAAAPLSSALQATASGTLPNGSTVIINTDGTVSAVSGIAEAAGAMATFTAASVGYVSAAYDQTAQKVVIAYRDYTAGDSKAIVGTVSGNSITFGTPVTFLFGNVFSTATAYDANTQKIVIAYQDGNNSFFCTAIVGTVSGTSISFGTPVVFSSENGTVGSAVYDVATQKVVIGYQGASQFGNCIVGTVSGTSISFGTAVVFASMSSGAIRLTYESFAQKIVVSWSGTSSFGRAIVGTVSGTSISFGTAVVFNGIGIPNGPFAAYDSNSQKVVITYTETGSIGYAIVGTVSGTSISFGAAVTVATNINALNIGYDPSAKKVNIIIRNGANSNFGTSIVGTVSGTTISFATPFVFNSVDTISPIVVYDPNAQKNVILYVASQGRATVLQNATTNITSENFIGFSDANYTNGQTATVQLVGAVDDAQSGLTAGQSYYVQPLGTLGLTPATPSVFAGTAVSATRIIVKG
jgi:hypothetical protein